MRNYLFPLVTVFSLLTPYAPAAQEAQPKTLFERWYVLMLGQERAGWSRQQVTEGGEGIVTESETQIEVRRGGPSIRMRSTSRFVEAQDGRPIRAESVQMLGALEIRQSLTFGVNGVVLETAQGSQVRRQLVQAPTEPWLAPQAASRYVESQLAAGAKEIRYWTMDPGIGPKPVQVSASVTGPATVEVFGKAVPAIAWNSTISILPGVTAEEFVDGAGRPIRSLVRIATGLELTLLQADEALARLEVDPPELMAATLITPDRPIEQARALRQAVYELRLSKPTEVAWVPAASQPANAAVAELPEAGYQRVVWGEQGVARVVVDLDDPVNPGEDLPREADLTASLVVNSDDGQIRQMAGEALRSRPGSSDAVQAEALRQFVHRFVKTKDLSVGFATASEVARTGEGDCTEHAVLLAAMLRSVKIPSRTVSGLIYVDSFLGRSGVFGYHMWTQAWITDGGGRWVDLDATLASPFDAAHIALATNSHQDDGGANDLVKMAQWLGGLEVKVVEAGGE